MYDPRGEDLSKIKDDDLVERISNLHKRMKFFYTTGNNQAILQLNVMLAEANAEQERRWAKQGQAQLDKKEKNNILDN
jgi:ABC-type transport system involved in cytochrome bd biosynthesis fused ATPase/permease subunit